MSECVKGHKAWKLLHQNLILTVQWFSVSSPHVCQGERGRVGERPQGRGRESDLQVALMRQANLQLEL